MMGFLTAPWHWPWRRTIVCLMKRLATRWPWLLLVWGVVMLIALGSVLFTPATYRYTSVYHLATAQQREAPAGSMALVSPSRLVGCKRPFWRVVSRGGLISYADSVIHRRRISSHVEATSLSLSCLAMAGLD